MQAFWESLSILQKILYCIAVPSTLVLVLQTILLFFGWGEHGGAINPSDTSGLDLDFGTPDTGGLDIGDLAATNVDMPTDGSSPGDFGTLRLFTLQGIIAFLCIFGWSGLALSRTALPPVLCLLPAAALGFLFMFLVAYIFHLMYKLSDNGNISIRSTLGCSGTVYLTIPAGGDGQGKVNVMVGSQWIEYNAITESSVPLPTGSRIRIVDIRGDLVLVEPE